MQACRAAPPIQEPETRGADGRAVPGRRSDCPGGRVQVNRAVGARGRAGDGGQVPATISAVTAAHLPSAWRPSSRQALHSWLLFA